MTIAAHGIRAKLLEEAQSGADDEPRRKIARPRPVELGGKSAPIVVRDRERMNQRSAVAARPQETAAARRKEPLVAIAGVPVGAERRHVELELPRRVRTIHEYQGAALACRCDDLFYRPNEARRRRDVVDGNQPRTFADRLK